MKKHLFILIASLFLCGTIFAQTPEHHWTAPTNTTSNQTTAIWVSLDDNFLDDPNIEVAAFIGENVTMSSFLQIIDPAFDHMFIWNTVNFELDESGSTITFKMYNHTTMTEYDLCDETATAEINGKIGTADDPFVLHFHSYFDKPVTGYNNFTNSDGGYYLIASPVAASINPNEVEGMTDGSYDLYYFDQTHELEWVNYKNTPFNLESGKGYLYAHNSDITLRFIGAPYNSNGTVTLEKKTGANVEFSGWNLVGNPWAETAYITKGFYTLDDQGYEVIAGEGNSVEAMQGIFVIADTDGEEMVFSTTSTADASKLVIDLSQERGDIIDRAVIKFSEGGTLPKFQLHADNTKLYIPQNDEDYAIVNASTEGDLPLCFKAAERGIYTLTVTVDATEASYLHLIDNQAGIDQDMLSCPRYSFEADVNDDPNRFVIQFHATATSIDEERFSPIAYNRDGSLTINGIEGEAQLTIIDMLGRVVSNERFQGDIVRHIGNTPGVYVVRIVTEDNTYSQKIVVE